MKRKHDDLYFRKTTYPANSFFACDLNTDDLNDFVYTELYGSDFVVINQAKEYGDLDPRYEYTVDDGPYDIAVGDVNNDGFDDIVTCGYGNNDEISILYRDQNNMVFSR